MTYTVTPPDTHGRQPIGCDRCGASSEPTLFASVRDAWKRAHVCVRAHLYDQRTAVQR